MAEILTVVDLEALRRQVRFFFSSRRRHTSSLRDWSSDVCSSDLIGAIGCRLERNDQGGNFVCAMYDNSGRATDGRCVGPQPCSDGGAVGSDGPPGRIWETQGVGTQLT